MPDRDASFIEDVVRARRLEIVDENDRVRALIGRLGTGGRGEAVIGVALVGDRGSHRAWLALDVSGPALVFNQDGNNVIYLGVDDADTDAMNPGPYIELCGRDGATAIRWRVLQNGAVDHRTTGITTP